MGEKELSHEGNWEAEQAHKEPDVQPVRGTE